MWKNLGSKIFEVRFAFCQRSSGSSGIRSFLHNEYIPMKKANPTLPILVRECQDTVPRMTVRYNYGIENSIVCDGLNDIQIREKLKQFAVDEKQLEQDVPKSAIDR
eukprot:891437_1